MKYRYLMRQEANREGTAEGGVSAVKENSDNPVGGERVRQDEPFGARLGERFGGLNYNIDGS
jgi:hypothetical protein